MSIKYFCTAIVLLCSLLICGCSKSSSTSLIDTNGKIVNLKDYWGKWIIINYWASWCSACFEEVPELNAFYLAHKDKDAVVLGFNYEQLTIDQLPPLIQRMGILFPNLATDPSRELGIVNIPGLPISFLIGADGQLKRVLMGSQTQKTLELAMKMTSSNKPSS